MLRSRTSGADYGDASTSSEQCPSALTTVPDSIAAATTSAPRRNTMTKGSKRHCTLQQQTAADVEDDSCRSTLAATADEAPFTDEAEPSGKRFKADSPGEACNG